MSVKEREVRNADQGSGTYGVPWFHIENASGGQELRPWTRVAVGRWV